MSQSIKMEQNRAAMLGVDLIQSRRLFVFEITDLNIIYVVLITPEGRSVADLLIMK